MTARSDRLRRQLDHRAPADLELHQRPRLRPEPKVLFFTGTGLRHASGIDIGKENNMADFGPVGGPGGSPFDDLTDLGLDAATIRILGLIIRSDANEFVNAITPIYTDGSGQLKLPKHGGNGGTEVGLGLRAGEFITEISGRSGQFLDSLTIETNQGVRIGFGGPGGGPVEGYEIPPDTVAQQEVVAFFGASGDLIDNLGIHTRPHP